MTADGMTVLLSIDQPERVTPISRRTTGLYHLAFLLPNRFDLGRVIKHLLKQEYPLQGAEDHLVSKSLYMTDTDGNGIDIYFDCNSSKWVWKNNEVVMPSEPLEADKLLEAASESTWDGLPTATLLCHIHLHVNDMSKNLNKGLGFKVVSRYGEQASFISDGKYHDHITLNKKRDNIVFQLKAIGAMISTKRKKFVVTAPSGNRIYLSY